MPPCQLGSLSGGDPSRQEKGGSSQCGIPKGSRVQCCRMLGVLSFFQLSWLGAKDASVPVAVKSALPTLCEMPLGVVRGNLVCCYRAASFSPRDIMMLVLVR